MQITGLDPVQLPDWQVSVWVQASPSLQGVPLDLGGSEQIPVEELQVPALWHWSEAVQTTGLDPVHTPNWQVSVWVHRSPSLQGVPSVLGGSEQIPVDGLQVPALWHWSSGEQLIGFDPVHEPD